MVPVTPFQIILRYKLLSNKVLFHFRIYVSSQNMQNKIHLLVKGK